LLNLSIAAGCQRQGWGSRLLQRVCECARGRRVRLLFLEVRPSNAAALRLYEGHGFERIGLRRDYYPASGGREDALILGLPL
jgi:ribosomal-protein-alanine N-acetyltransferase